MRTIIAGSRTAEAEDVKAALTSCPFPISIALSGTARGADQLGEAWARREGIPIERYPADWNRYGKRAGYLRNEEMAKHADALIAVWDGFSKGTAHMIQMARKYNLKLHIHRFGECE